MSTATLDTLADAALSRLGASILERLDFDPCDDDAEECQHFKTPGVCQNPAVWRMIMNSPCPHDGSFVSLCQSHFEWGMDFIREWSPFVCKACVPAEIDITVTWERI